jgi:hypothetical protein
MTAVYADCAIAEDQRRSRLYKGDIFVFTPRPSIVALRDHAREMIESAFAPLDPLTAQHHMPVEQYVSIVAPLKPAFIHHVKTKAVIQALLAELGCNMEKTYLDVPRLRMVTSDGYLTAGVGYAFHPHRDTWYSAPMCQLNWWMPIYDIDSGSSFAIYPRYFGRPVRNDSGDFNYYRWNSEGRKNAAHHIKTDTRPQPKPLEPVEVEPQIRVVVQAGGIVLFSPAHLHSTVPNTTGSTRYSIDFRTVDYDDVAAKRGVPNVDSAPTGTSLRDFMKGTDFSRLPADLVRLYDDTQVEDGVLVYQPS